EDAVTRGKIGDAGADGLDLAGELVSGNDRKRAGVPGPRRPGRLPRQLARRDRRRAHAHQQLARARTRERRLLVDQGFGTAPRLETDRVHGGAHQNLGRRGEPLSCVSHGDPATWGGSRGERNMVQRLVRARRSASRLAAALVAGWVATSSAQPVDPLPSWNEGPTRQAIASFVAKTTTQGSP